MYELQLHLKLQQIQLKTKTTLNLNNYCAILYLIILSSWKTN